MYLIWPVPLNLELSNGLPVFFLSFIVFEFTDSLPLSISSPSPAWHGHRNSTELMVCSHRLCFLDMNRRMQLSCNSSHLIFKKLHFQQENKSKRKPTGQQQKCFSYALSFLYFIKKGASSLLKIYKQLLHVPCDALHWTFQRSIKRKSWNITFIYPFGLF